MSELAARLVGALHEQALTLAVAESLTGGMVMAAITEIPGASSVLRGGPVVYATDTKASELGVDVDLLKARGPVDRQVAEAMAVGVRERWNADVGLATTGVAGPGGQDGHPVGEVYVAVADASSSRVISCAFGELEGRHAIRQLAVEQAFFALAAHIGISGEATAE